MKIWPPIPDFIAASGANFIVNKRRIKIIHIFTTGGINYPDKGKKFKNCWVPSISPIPDFVVDPNGLVTPTNQRRTILIHILSIRNPSPPTTTNKTDPEKSMTSYKPDYQHVHHRKHLPNHPATSAHRGMSIQRNGTLSRCISTSIRRNGMSKEATIAIIMKLLLVSWDLWTYRIGFKLITKNLPPLKF